MMKMAFGSVAFLAGPSAMELSLDFTPSPQRPMCQLEQDRLEEMVACLQMFIGHELPNILGPCQAYARELGKKAQLDKDARHDLERLAALTYRAGTWSLRLAEIGRLLRGSPWGPAIELDDVVVEAVAEVRVLAAQPGTTYHVSGPLPALCVSRSLLHAVLVELLRNSTRAILTDSPGLVEVTRRREPEGCLLVVRDNGRGMASEQARLLREPFAAARLAGAAGIGLGFFLVRQAVARWGGTLHVRSEVGQGTTVELLVPGAREQT
jgi:signal transduction histidine kinase